MGFSYEKADPIWFPVFRLDFGPPDVVYSSESIRKRQSFCHAQKVFQSPCILSLFPESLDSTPEEVKEENEDSDDSAKTEL